MNHIERRYASPESVGIPSRKIIEFIEELKRENYNIHSFMIIKDGKIVTEAYYAPFVSSDLKRLYSSSKTIAALAVGKLVGEGLVQLSDPLVKYFPRHKDCHAELRAVTIEDVLTMTLPLSSCPYTYGRPGYNETNDIIIHESWIDSFFTGTCLAPQEKANFKYNSHGSYMLGALVQTLTGKSFIEYLRDIFDKIGVGREITCVNSPEGIAWGASGVLCTLRDFAAIGELLLNKGYVSGEQLLPREYMERAVSPLVSTPRVETDFASGYGYGYQIWTEPYGFGMHGMFGQAVSCYPDKSMLFVATSWDLKYKELLYRASAKIYEASEDHPLVEGEDYQALCALLPTLRIDRSLGTAHADLERRIHEKTIVFEENAARITSCRLSFGTDHGTFYYQKEGSEHALDFGYGEFVDTVFPERSYYSMTMTVPSGREPRTLVTGSFTAENELCIVCDVVDTLYGTLYIRLCFEGERVHLDIEKIGEAIFADYITTADGVLK